MNGELRYAAIAAEKRWGKTCPVLNIAKAYRVPYALALGLADYFLHDRSFDANLTNGVDEGLLILLAEQCNGVACMMRYLQLGGEL